LAEANFFIMNQNKFQQVFQVGLIKKQLRQMIRRSTHRRKKL